jgi:hexosaminidase
MCGFISESRRRGYALLPVPQRIEFGEGRFETTRLSREFHLAGVASGDIAVRALGDVLSATGACGETPVELSLDPGVVPADLDDARRAQGYRILVSADRVCLTGGGLPGLYYAVQTLRQLLDHPSGALPICTIVDWPEYELRCVHWDTKHHQDRLPTLKRFLDQCAALKINAVLFELEDKFEYPSHPVIGAPGAFTAAELQALTDYALERQIELIPDVQSPAHLCYVLKHAE